VPVAAVVVAKEGAVACALTFKKANVIEATRAVSSTKTALAKTNDGTKLAAPGMTMTVIVAGGTMMRTAAAIMMAAGGVGTLLAAAALGALAAAVRSDAAAAAVRKSVLGSLDTEAGA